MTRETGGILTADEGKNQFYGHANAIGSNRVGGQGGG